MDGSAHYSIRLATGNDVDFLADVVLAATRAQGRLKPGMEEPQWHTNYCQWTAVQIKSQSPSNTTSVIEIGGMRAGRLRVLRRDQSIELAGIQLMPKFQGQGVGTAIIESLKDEASDAGAALELGVEKDNPDARRLYRRLGFVGVGETDDEHRLRWRA